MKLRKKRLYQAKKIKYIVKESYSGTRTSKEVFSDIFISEHEGNSSKTWTSEQKHDIIQETDNSQISCCSRKE